MSNPTLTHGHDAKTIERFWPKVDKSGDCWIWTAGRYGFGHGQFSVKGRSTPAHRVSFEMANGPIPPGLVIDHICHNAPCVNPAHLRAVTQKQNLENQVSAHTNSKSGVRGVHWRKRTANWEVSVRHHGKTMYGGKFQSLEQAERAAIDLRLRLFTCNDADRAS